jgi:uncharacterized membrane protein
MYGMVAATADPLLVFVALLGTSVWVGGLVAVAVVARVASSQLDAPGRVEFFRALGRAHGVVGGCALVITLASGGALLAERQWDGAARAAVVCGASLLLATGVGVAQARAMTRLRRRALAEPNDDALARQVRKRARLAAALRATIGVLSVALLALATVLST